MVMTQRRSVPAVLALALIMAGSVAQAEVTRVDTRSRTDVAGGRAFGDVGPYEALAGTIVSSCWRR